MQFSLIIPMTDSNAHLLPLTLSSALTQHNTNFEILLVDGRTRPLDLDIPQGERARLIISKDTNTFRLMNIGLSQAVGDIVHFIQPGEFYLSGFSLSLISEFSEQSERPDLIQTGAIVRHSLAPRQMVLSPLREQDLRSGHFPSCLQSFWFRRTALQGYGGFDDHYPLQAGMDLMCRLYISSSTRKVFLKRVLTDYEYRRAPARTIISQALETLQIIYRHFGLSPALFIWMSQNYGRLIRWWLRSLRRLFLHKHHAST